MFLQDLDELEFIVLNKRLEHLKEKGLEGKLLFNLGADFFALLADKWTFAGILSTINGLQEMYDNDRDDAVGATLPAPKKKRGHKRKAVVEEV